MGSGRGKQRLGFFAWSGEFGWFWFWFWVGELGRLVCFLDWPMKATSPSATGLLSTGLSTSSLPEFFLFILFFLPQGTAGRAYLRLRLVTNLLHVNSETGFRLICKV
jgi:hypothetical protein